MHSRVRSMVLFSFAAIVGIAAMESLSSRAEAAAAPSYRPAPSGVCLAAMLPATATFAWLAPAPVIPTGGVDQASASTGPVGEWCSTSWEGETCSVGNGGATNPATCSANGMSHSCSAGAWNGENGGRCSASVDGGGTATQSCSAYGFASTCSVQGDDGKAACSATGRATCSSSGTLSHCSAHNSSGSGTACSVTNGSGGTCTTNAAGTGGSCSVSMNGQGHCSSWGGGQPNSGPDPATGQCKG